MRRNPSGSVSLRREAGNRDVRGNSGQRLPSRASAGRADWGEEAIGRLQGLTALRASESVAVTRAHSSEELGSRGPVLSIWHHLPRFFFPFLQCSGVAELFLRPQPSHTPYLNPARLRHRGVWKSGSSEQSPKCLSHPCICI